MRLLKPSVKQRFGRACDLEDKIVFGGTHHGESAATLSRDESLALHHWEDRLDFLQQEFERLHYRGRKSVSISKAYGSYGVKQGRHCAVLRAVSERLRALKA